ncbi:MAG: aldehyde dehydrogenase family protein, partial [Anaerolineales bacterium]|nr:aldehyde dehydrogenase family protein [Anaerolineales bacterium]
MFINGEWQQLTATFPVFNPATGEELGQVAAGGTAEARAAIQAAHAAFRTWSATTAYYRSAILYRAYQLMVERKQALAELMTREQGKPLKTALNEVQYGADFLLWFAEEAKRIYGETIPSARPEQRFLVQHQPVGVVAAITPWNYPVSMITRKVAPALAAGCTVVLKPAESTPLCAIAIFEILAEAGVPAGVVNLVTAADPRPIGTEFCTNPLVKKLTFTGSTAVGKKLAQDAAAQLKRVSLELGGHAPFIVYEDADPVHAA